MVDPQLAPGRVPDGRRVYVIGDVHGCLERLVSLHFDIAADLAARPVAHSALIHLGDYVDRGPDSAGVLWLLAGAVKPQVNQRVDLKGNHEVMMLNALTGNRQSATHWLDNGGDATLESYGIDAEGQLHPATWRAAVPDLHVEWIQRLELMHREGNYLFVHAGIRPGVALRAQTPEDLMWIREPFLSNRDPRDVVVVHGHTPRPAPDVFENRIGIDTGAAMNGRLTCMVLEGEEMRFLTA
jgi:serine/threonine protein phosphatase 1